MGLCRSCHRKIDGDIGGTDLKLRKRLQWKAVERLVGTYGMQLPRTRLGVFGRRVLDPVGLVRRAIGELREEDIKL
jgi:hypothetical protein